MYRLEVMLDQRFVYDVSEIQFPELQYPLEENVVKEIDNCIVSDRRTSANKRGRIRLTLRERNKSMSTLVRDFQGRFFHDLDRVKDHFKRSARQRDISFENEKPRRELKDVYGGSRLSTVANTSEEERPPKTDSGISYGSDKPVTSTGGLPIFLPLSELSKSASDCQVEHESEPNSKYRFEEENISFLGESVLQYRSAKNASNISRQKNLFDDSRHGFYDDANCALENNYQKGIDELFPKNTEPSLDYDDIGSDRIFSHSFEPLITAIAEPSINKETWHRHVLGIFHSKEAMEEEQGFETRSGVEDNNSSNDFFFVWEFRDNKFIKTPCKPFKEGDFQWDVGTGLKERFSVRKYIRRERMRLAGKMYYCFKSYLLKDTS